MEYTEDKLTVWFDADKVKPNKEGAYEVIFARGNDGHRMWSYWDGKSFNSGWLTPDSSYDHKDFPHFRSTSGTQPIQWRGLNFNTNAPKPKKGNKRKTMYVVMQHQNGFKSVALAVFDCKQLAEKRKTWFEKNITFAFHPATYSIDTVRNRHD